VGIGDDPFTWQVTKDGRVLVFRSGRQVAVIADPATQLRARGWVLSQGLLALPYYLRTHDGMVRMAHRAITAALDPPP
jgi:hypothetical protein